MEVGTGTTEVSFEHFGDLTNCAYEATVGLASQSATAFPGFATVVRSSAHDDAVYVQTYNMVHGHNQEASLASLGFHLSGALLERRGAKRRRPGRRQFRAQGPD